MCMEREGELQGHGPAFTGHAGSKEVQQRASSSQLPSRVQNGSSRSSSRRLHSSNLISSVQQAKELGRDWNNHLERSNVGKRQLVQQKKHPAGWKRRASSIQQLTSSFSKLHDGQRHSRSSRPRAEAS
ncbi:hypothetical protein VIGAN_08300100 [Vigna angularis var. angularis]|uniref:Uncharacterized protein n=1 Tax=Vigna angularis var. angularis TaxID=157739 RepID=A0A0S3STJ0_PHAAN|nr:hypothetical protein VIGAN_08300100 [Vigna angularis var. angularis]